MHLVAQLYADPADCSGKPQRSLKAEVNAGQGAMDRSREECPAQQPYTQGAEEQILPTIISGFSNPTHPG